MNVFHLFIGYSLPNYKISFTLTVSNRWSSHYTYKEHSMQVISPPVVQTQPKKLSV